MGLETLVDYLDDLDSNWPLNTDGLVNQDDHTRNIKKSLKQTFPGSGGTGFNKPITATEDELNIVDGGSADSSVILTSTDQIIVNDAGVMKQTALSDLDVYRRAVAETLTNKILTSPDINTPDIDGGTINGLATLGIKILPAPVEIVNVSTIDTNVLVDMSAVFAEAFNNGATAALIVADITATGSAISSNVTCSLYAHSTAPGTTSLYRKLRSGASTSPSSVIAASISGMFVVPLDVNSDFYWRNTPSSGGTRGGSTVLKIIGYMV